MSKAIYEWRRIPDGPRLAVATVADSECAALSIYIPAGSRDEDGRHELLLTTGGHEKKNQFRIVPE